MEKSEKTFVGRIRFRFIAKVGRIKGVSYGGAAKDKSGIRE